MLLFIAVAGALYVLYTKPEVVPGHRAPARPITYTSIPGMPTVDVVSTKADEGTKADGTVNAKPEGEE